LNILAEILERKRKEVADAKRRVPVEELQRRIARVRRGRSFGGALRRAKNGPIRVLAEIKRASPSKGSIWRDADPAQVARDYEANGAAAISVLTDKDFGAELDFLDQVRGAVELPLLRKDFIIDRYQILEARAHGASAILLIVAALEKEELRDLHLDAIAAGLEVLCEVHNEEEAQAALDIGVRTIGVNHRDLTTFKIDLDLSRRLKPLFPASCVLIAESGINTADDAREIAEAGYDAILVGESLMRNKTPGASLKKLLEGL
jgi:indole-3-glycerol phosphate synthase